MRSVPRTACAEPRLGRDRLARRLRPHEQPRRRARASRCRSTLPDKRELRAKVVGVDAVTDIARAQDRGARTCRRMPWGDSSKLKVAEWVLAIGNPFQLNQTVTLGIVSATGRRLEGRLATYEDFIQTDAAINPGNSGGALINARGELIGINTAIFSETGGYQGIGFAVPSNLARHVMDDLDQVRRGAARHDHRHHAAAVDDQIADQLGAPNTRGAWSSVSMQQRSDAYAAGLRPGDIIVSFNGTHRRRCVAVRAAAVRREDRTHRHARRASRRTAGYRQGADRQGQRPAPPPRVVLPRRRAISSFGRTRHRCRPQCTATRHVHSRRDPDARRPGDLPARQPAILDRSALPVRSSRFCPKRDAERPRQVARAAAQLRECKRRGRNGRSHARAAGASALRPRAARAHESAPQPASPPASVTALTR